MIHQYILLIQYIVLQVIELPLLNPELFQRVGITPPKGCLLYGPPGTGKTLLARAVASQLDANFLKVVSSAIVDKYIGESARLIREMFGKYIHMYINSYSTVYGRILLGEILANHEPFTKTFPDNIHIYVAYPPYFSSPMAFTCIVHQNFPLPKFYRIQ